MAETKFKRAGSSATSPTDFRTRKEVVIKAAPVCWLDDHEVEISTSIFGHFCDITSLDGKKLALNNRCQWKLIVPTKASTSIVVEFRFLAQSKPNPFTIAAERADPKSDWTQKSIASRNAEVEKIKSSLIKSIDAVWNGKFKMSITDPICGEKILPITYHIVWVDKGEHYKIIVHEQEVHEKVANDSEMLVWYETTDATLAHEFSHCIGMPDEYSHHPTESRIVRYYKPDGTRGPAITALVKGYRKEDSSPNGNIMSQVESTKVELYHAWGIAIEVQALLSKNIGRNIKCEILAA